MVIYNFISTCLRGHPAANIGLESQANASYRVTIEIITHNFIATCLWVQPAANIGLESQANASYRVTIEVITHNFITTCLRGHPAFFCCAVEGDFFGDSSGGAGR